MTWKTQSCQRSKWFLLLIALVLSLSLVACGEQVNANGTNIPNNNTFSQQQQHQSNQPARSNSASATNTNAGANLQSTDQQVQSILSQLDSARNDVNSSNAAASQDNGQQP